MNTEDDTKPELSLTCASSTISEDNATVLCTLSLSALASAIFSFSSDIFAFCVSFCKEVHSSLSVQALSMHAHTHGFAACRQLIKQVVH